MDAAKKYQVAFVIVTGTNMGIILIPVDAFGPCCKDI